MTAQLLFVLGAGAAAEVVLSLKGGLKGDRAAGPAPPSVPEWLMAL